MSRKQASMAMAVVCCLVWCANRGVTQEATKAKTSARCNATSLTRFAATIAAAFDIEPPKLADKRLDEVCDKIRELAGGPIDRVVIYNPDAVAQWLTEKHADMFQPVLEHTQIKLPMATMMPSVTPVCFGTMYTGAVPEVHGIKVYSKPVIKIDTLFDCLVRSGKRAAIVAAPDCSMAKIFLNRKIDYFNPPDAKAGIEKAQELIEQDRHDFIVVYNGDYDSTMHRTGTESKEALKALEFQADGFDALAKCIEKHWTRHNTLITFSTDHGVHDALSGSKTIGKHGTSAPEDINIVHYLGVIRGKDLPRHVR
jgi:hypothetical protein